MSDARLREVERRWKETGSPDDEAAYLLERVRVGDLTRERLELAAYCGHGGSQIAVGDHLRVEWDHSTWIEGLQRLGGMPAVAAFACGVTNGVLSIQASLSPKHRLTLKQQIDLAEAWIGCPCDEHFQAFFHGLPLGSDNLHEVGYAFRSVMFLATPFTAEGSEPAHVVIQSLISIAVAVCPKVTSARMHYIARDYLVSQTLKSGVRRNST